ncbi:arylamine N-acetyltransferase [Streptomyces sp. NPDC015127]|uniref:arylamine N-acetyltransferase family protein n=1 Tax=Streptomyces sp. NPDC015127 TaxID=3364939 RepID=UPI0036FCF05A
MSDPTTVRAYLDRLGVDGAARPDLDTLRRLQAAHLERVPFENLDIQLGRPSPVDDPGALPRILSGRGGYCFHLNGSFATLLTLLGYRVTRHRGGVQDSADQPPPGDSGNHLTLTVRLADEDGSGPGGTGPGGTGRDGSGFTDWFVDVGIGGDGPREPIPLRPGTSRQGPFTYRLGRSPVVPGGWRFTHDARGSFAAMDFAPGPAGRGDFTVQNEFLTTHPDSRFVRTAVVGLRDAEGLTRLLGTVLTRIDGSGRRSHTVTSEEEYYGTLQRVFGITLTDVPQAERSALWRRLSAAHEHWLATRSS